jgi:hypothetical protein
MSLEEDKWHQIVISDSNFLSGESVYSFTSRIVMHFGIKWIRINDIEGAVWGLVGRARSLLPATEFMSLVKQAAQYDWAFFFMYLSDPPRRREDENNDKMDIRRSDLTVRLADDTDIFVYTRSGDIASQIQRWYPSATYRLIQFECLDIPY